MSVTRKVERSLLSHDEFEAVRATHHPAIYDLTGKDLQALKVRLREQRNKSRGLARQLQREARGKAEKRGKSFPGAVDQPLKRKQVFAAAIKRINKELERLRRLEARAVNVEAAHRALALHRAAQFRHSPRAGDTPGEGMQPNESRRRRVKVPPSKIGSISQATKVAQAVRDARE
jgi:hypothetical protein